MEQLKEIAIKSIYEEKENEGINREKQVIIIDDEERIGNICCKALEKIGISADIARSAESGLEMIKGKRYKVILLDIVLPGMDGMKLLNIIKEKYPSIEVIMLTGNATIEDSVRAMKVGAYDFITKPFEVYEIRKVVQKAMEKEQLARQVKELKEVLSIFNVAKAIGRIMPLDKLLRIIFKSAKISLSSDGGCIVLKEPETGHLKIEYVESDEEDDDLEEKLKNGIGIYKYVAAEKKPLVINGNINAELDYETISSDEIFGGINSGMVMPMIVKDEVIGVLNFIRLSNEDEYNEYDLKIATIFSQQAAMAIQNAKDFEQLKKLDDLKTEFISNVSHELRTPLTPIRETVSQMLDGILGEINDKQEKYLSISIKNIDRLKRMIDNLLDVAKIEAGRIDIDRDLVDMTNIAKRVALSFSAQAKNKGLKIKTRVSQEKIDLLADEDKIIQVLNNLIGNSIKFTEKGHVEVSVKDKGNYIECSVYDTGRGIAKSNLDKVFDKFYQLGKVASGEKGTGLGLSISQGIIGLHKGRISVDSIADEWTRFSFTLPKYLEGNAAKERIDSRIAKARRYKDPLILYMIKFENIMKIKETIGGQKTGKLLFELLSRCGESLNNCEPLGVKDEDTVLLLIKAQKEEVHKTEKKLKKIIKEATCRLEKDCPIEYLHSYALYPEDDSIAEGLLKTAEENLVSEKAERLNKKIMIADDDAGSVNSIKRVLEKAEYKNFTLANSGEEVIEIIEHDLPDLLILDIKMPGMNGYEVIGRLKGNADTYDIPILIVSGYKVDMEKIEEYVADKAVLTIGKPFNKNNIRKLVKFLL
ncbi:response regulator [Elusimicrobiota bacterium]